jgi:hypothetical protein
MNQALKKSLLRFSHIPYWVFLVLFLTSSAVSVMALRGNNETMIKLRTAVYDADKNNGDINAALNNLRRYVYGHMNTNLSSGGNAIKPPIQQSQSQAQTTNSNLYTEAENYCQAQIPANLSFSGRARVPCVQNYVSTHGVTASQIPAALYEFDFISPSWSPDLAGWSLVLSALFFLAFVTSFTADKLLKAKLQPL